MPDLAPSRAHGAQRFRYPVDHCDLFMTLADAAGCDCVYLAATRGRSGHSYLPLLSEASANVAGQRRDAQFREYGNTRMIRTNLYKLIELYRGPNGHFPVELYNWPRKRKQTHVMAIKRSYSISEARWAGSRDPKVNQLLHGESAADGLSPLS